MTSTTEIYLVRHGQSLHNEEERIAGQLDSQLTELGFEDARSVAHAIGCTDFDVIYCSDLLRARQTADAIIRILQLNCPIQFSSALRELDYGEYTEKSVEETFRFMNYKQEQQTRYPNGESFQDLGRRVERFIRHLLDESAGRRILVTAHAGSIRLMAMLLDPYRKQEHLDRNYGNRFLGRARLDSNGSLSSFEVIQNPGRASM